MMRTKTELFKILFCFFVFSVGCFHAEAYADESLLNGEYIVNQFMDDDVNSDGHSKVARLEMTFDGNGNGSYIELESSTSGAGDTGDFTYTVDSDGTVSLFDEKGVVSSDGNVFTLSDTGSSDNDVHIMVGVKKGSGLSESTLNGTYIFNGLMDDRVNTDGNRLVYSQEVSLDGEGSGSYETIASSTGSDDSGEGTYAVDSDGTIEVGAGTGIVSSDGNFWSASEADTSNNAVQLMVGLKKGSGLSDSTLNGTYFVNEFRVENTQSEVSRLAVTFDGNGNGEYITLSNSKGLNKSESFQYSVESDGTLTIEDVGVIGVVGAAGEYFTLIEPDAFNQNNIMMAVGIESMENGGAKEKCYYFPHIASNTNWETETCLINKSAEKLTGTLTAFNNQGEKLSEKNLTLAENGRQSLIVGNEFSDPEEIGYIVFESDSSNVCGYTKFYKEGHYRVAVPAVQEINSGDIYIPHIASNSNWWTGLALVNTTNSTKTLTFTFSNGAVKKKDWAPGEHKKFTIKQLFGGSSQPEIESAVITGGAGVIGLELFSKGKTLSGVTVKDDSADTLYFPHVASNDKWWTGIAAYNPSGSKASLTITPYTEEGTALSVINKDITAKGKYLGSSKDLGLPENTAWLKIDSSQNLSGFELFGTKNGNSLGGYSTININCQEGVFSKLDKEGWTGIAFVNTTNKKADITLYIYDNDGFQIASKSITLNGYEKIVNTPEDIFGGPMAGGAYLKFDANEEVVGFQLNGSSDGMMLDALPVSTGGSDSNGNDGVANDDDNNSVSEAKTNSIGMTFNYIEPGTFMMGSPEDEPGRFIISETQHQVTLTQGYYMQTTEVTQGQWEAVMGNNPSFFSNCGSDCPVESVSWNKVQDFIAALNNLEDTDRYALPTEAQWEYAARAGSATAFANGEITETGSGYDPVLESMGWYIYNSNSRTHPVAQKTSNAWGLYDMHGNVAEWVADWAGSYPSSAVTDPTGPSSGNIRSVRGGSWGHVAGDCRSASRGGILPSPGHANIGFRLILLPDH